MYAFLSRKVIYPMYGLASGHRILPYLAQMEESQWWSPDVLAAWQNASLSQLLRHGCMSAR